MRELTSGALLDAIRGVHWPARRVVGGLFQGAHRSRRVGSSPEFMQYRAYQQGDDPSKIDWKLFGRTERVAIRMAHDDSSLRTMVVVDASASMAFPAETLGKWELAAGLGLGLCAAAHSGNDPVGLAVAGSDQLRTLAPRTRRGMMAQVLEMLLDVQPSGAAPIAPVVRSLRANRRVAVVSDFLGDADALLDVSRELAAGGREVYAVHVVAREELEPAAQGEIVTDPEQPALTRALSPAVVTEYQSQFRAWREQLAAAFRAAGVTYHEAVTGVPVDRIVRRIVG